MISQQESNLTVTAAVTKLGTYYTLSEQNFGSFHHATFKTEDLRLVLQKLREEKDERNPKFQHGGVAYSVHHGDVWQNYPFPGIIRIWESSEGSDKRRHADFTDEQVHDLLVHFRKILC